MYRKSGFSSGGNAMIVNDDPGVNDSGDEAEAFHQDQVYGYSDSQARDEREKVCTKKTSNCDLSCPPGRPP